MVAQGADLEAQGVQVDEALGVALAIDGVGLEGRKVGPVERPRRPPSCHRHVALVQREPHGPRHVTGDLVHEPLERAPLRRKPEAVVDHLGVARDERVAQVQDLAVERERLHRPSGHVQDGAAGRLVDAPRLHSHVAILDEVHAANAVLAAETVEALEQRHRPEGFASTATGLPASKSISTSSGTSGAASGELVSWNILSGGAAHGSSRIPPSYEMWKRLRSVEYGRSAVTGTGMSCRRANSRSEVREFSS